MTITCKVIQLFVSPTPKSGLKNLPRVPVFPRWFLPISCESWIALWLFLIPWTYIYQKIIVRLCHPRWYQLVKFWGLAHGLHNGANAITKSRRLIKIITETSRKSPNWEHQSPNWNQGRVSNLSPNWKPPNWETPNSGLHCIAKNYGRF